MSECWCGIPHEFMDIDYETQRPFDIRDMWTAPTITPLEVTPAGKNVTYPYERGMQGQGPS